MIVVWAALAVWACGGVVAVVLLAGAAHRPVDDRDRRLAAIDRQLELEDERAAQCAARPAPVPCWPVARVRDGAVELGVGRRGGC